MAHVATWALAAAAAVTSTTPSNDAWTRPRFAAFGSKGSGWVAVALHRLEARPINIPGRTLESVAVAPDGQTVVFTAPDPGRGNSFLYRWRMDQAEVSPVDIGDNRGFHSDPFVSSDGAWVYFAHNPDARGGPGSHGAMAYAQLYRVHIDGTGLEQLTNSEGCHVMPFADGLNHLFYVHLTCMIGRRLQRLVGNREEDLTSSVAVMLEPTFAPDGTEFVASRPGGSVASVERFDLQGRTLGVVAFIDNAPVRLRPQYGACRRELLFQNTDAVWVVRGRETPERIVALNGSRP